MLSSVVSIIHSGWSDGWIQIVYSGMIECWGDAGGRWTGAEAWLVVVYGGMIGVIILTVPEEDKEELVKWKYSPACLQWLVGSHSNTGVYVPAWKGLGTAEVQTQDLLAVSAAHWEGREWKNRVWGNTGVRNTFIVAHSCWINERSVVFFLLFLNQLLYLA